MLSAFFACCSPRLQWRDRRQRPEQLRARLEHVELADVAAAESGLGDPDTALLDGNVFARDLELCLRGPDGDVGIRDLRDEQHERVVVAGDGRHHVGIGCLDRAPEFAPEVELPPDADADVVLIEPQVPSRGVGGIPAGRRVIHRAIGLLDLGIEVTHGDAQLGARFEDPQPGDLQVVVVAVGDLDQVAQHRIAGRLPTTGSAPRASA